MKIRNWMTVGAASLGAVGVGIAVNSFLPQRFATAEWSMAEGEASPPTASLPSIGVSFLRCGSVTVPELIAVRGAPSLAPRVISHSAVLVRHPRATFLYDTGLCTDISLFLRGQSWFFNNTIGKFVLEQSLNNHLQHVGIKLNDLDFALLSHLHWDHVSGIPDIPGVPLHINRVEYDAARAGLFEQHHGLVPKLMGDNPIELFDCAGPPYAGFRSSYDLFDDGSLVLVPLPGHTAGNTGLFINRSNGTRLFLLGDAAWVAENYLRPAPMHPFIWSRVTSDDATARQTLIDLHRFSRQHPEIPLIAMHDARMQESFMLIAQSGRVETTW